MRTASLFACLCLTLSACSGGAACPEGTFRRGGRCEPLDGIRDSGVSDAGPDAGLPDGAALDGAVLDGAVLDGAATDGALPDDASTARDASFDDAGACGVCPETRPLCDATRGECVECTRDDAAACGGFLCDTRTGDCTDRFAGTADLCAPCVADAECVDGASCVADPDDGAARCNWREDADPGPAGSCPDGARPFGAPLDTTSVDGAAVRVCTLARSSCVAYLDYLAAETCAVADDCGLATGDARCVDADPGAGESLRCSVACVTAADCPSGVSCVAAMGACQP